MVRILVSGVVLLLLAAGFPSEASSTIYTGSGSLGGTFAGWQPGTGWRTFWFTYDGPLQVGYGIRIVEDPDSPGGLATEIAMDVRTMHRAEWGTFPGQPLGAAFFSVSSRGWVPRVTMPPGYGPMSVALEGVASASGFVFVGEAEQAGSNLLIASASFAENSYNLPFSFSGVEIPEPAALLLVAAGIGLARLGRRHM